MSMVLAQAANGPWTLMWYALALVGIVGSALFSGAETGVYTVNRVRLHLLAPMQRGSALLERMIRRPNRLLGTLLIGNNLANYLSTYAIAVILAAAGYDDWQMVLVNAAILTPLLFVFGEVLPKDLFQNYSDRLTPHLGRPLWWLHRVLLLSGLLPMVDGVSRGLARLLRARDAAAAELHPRRLVTELIKEGLSQGVISPYQSDIINRVLRTEHRCVDDVMVPWRRVRTITTADPPRIVWDLADRIPFSRFPIIDESGSPIGVVNVFDVLLYEPDRCPPLKTLVQPAAMLSPQTSIRNALLALQQHHCPMALVMRNARPVGIITAKDLIEQVVGELEVW